MKNSIFYQSLNGLRGIAVLMVFFCHTGFLNLPGGYLGVDLFFVMSGFFITQSLLQELDQTGTIQLSLFYRKRILRIFPALFFLMFCYGIFTFFFPIDRQTFFNDFTSVIFSVANWTRALSLGVPRYVPHAWSLSIEEQFYAVWPIFLIFLWKILKNHQKLFFTFLSLIIFIFFYRAILFFLKANTYRIYVGTDTRADALLIGASIALLKTKNLFQNKIAKLEKFLVKFLAAPLLIFVFLSLNSDAESQFMILWGQTLIGICSAWIILTCLQKPMNILKRVLSFSPLVFIGKISYGIYLWHMTLFLILNGIFKMNEKEVFYWGTLLTAFFSVTSYFLIESPFLKLKADHQRKVSSLWKMAYPLVLASIIFSYGHFFSSRSFSLQRFSKAMIVAYGPTSAIQNTPFNLQADGTSALWVKMNTNMDTQCTLVFNGQKLSTAVAGEFLSAVLKKESLDFYGKARLEVFRGDQLIGHPVSIDFQPQKHN